MKKIPKYQDVKNYIKAKVKTGEYQPGEKIPNESELSALLDVSSITIKKAMTELVNEGVIYRIKGKGSYIREHQSASEPSSKKLVVFLLSCYDITDSSCMKIIMGIQKYLSPAGYSLIVENPGEDSEKEIEIIKRHLSNNVAGFIIFSANPEKNVGNYMYLRKTNTHFVLMDRSAEYFPSNLVACNNLDGAFMAVEYLIGLKHRNIGFVADKFFYLSSEKERFQGYCDAMKLSSLEVRDSMCFIDSVIDYERMVDAIKKREITALFVVNDVRAIELVNGLIDRKIDIPRDVSIMGFDDYEASKLARVPLSTIKQHFAEEGYYAAKLLLDSIRGSSMQYNKILIGTQVVIRSSTMELNSN